METKLLKELIDHVLKQQQLLIDIKDILECFNSSMDSQDDDYEDEYIEPIKTVVKKK